MKITLFSPDGQVRYTDCTLHDEVNFDGPELVFTGETFENYRAKRVRVITTLPYLIEGPASTHPQYGTPLSNKKNGFNGIQ